MSKSNVVTKNSTSLHSGDAHDNIQMDTSAIRQIGPEDRIKSPVNRKAVQTLIVPVGRGRGGKSFISKLTVECAKAVGTPLRFSDTDPKNVGLKDTHIDGVLVEDAHPQTLYDHARAEIEQFLEGNSSCLLDFGGGNPTFENILRELNLASVIKRQKKRLLLFCMLAPEKGDLSQIITFLDLPGLADADVVLCWNEGRVQPGREMSALKPFVEATPIVDALDRGARLVRLPRLAPAERIDDLGLTFRDAALGRASASGQRLGWLDTQITAEWLMRLPGSFAPIADWMQFAPVESLLSGIEV
jgi:hypothetical protein